MRCVQWYTCAALLSVPFFWCKAGGVPCWLCPKPLSGTGNQGKQRRHHLLLSHVPRACSAEAWAGSKPPEGASMDGSYTTQAHPFHFVPKVAGSTDHSRTPILVQSASSWPSRGRWHAQNSMNWIEFGSLLTHLRVFLFLSLFNLFTPPESKFKTPMHRGL